MLVFAKVILQPIGKMFIERRNAGARIDDEQNRIRSTDRGLCLLAHTRRQAIVEGILESSGAVVDAEERAQQTRKIFNILSDGLRTAIASAPEILFVNAAGNEDSDVDFDAVIPSSFDLPNLLTVGAVDQAGDPTSFTSTGSKVVLFTNGFEVESYVPGGTRLAASGTSQASPNATNLAAKLLATVFLVGFGAIPVLIAAHFLN